MSCAALLRISNVACDGLHQPVFSHDLAHEGGAPMITMTPYIAESPGTRLRVESVVPAYARAWKQRPAVVTLSGFSTDNCTGVSASERRHR